MFLDLHIHSTASDGSLTPEQVASRATALNLAVFSITDHDTVQAYDEINEANIGIPLIPGVELSAEFSGGTLHILGYGIDPFEKNLRATLDELQRFRLDRNRKMISNMARLGFDISFEEVLEEAGADMIGRPHFAALMLKKGYVATRQEAFDKYLKKGAPLYLDKKRLEPTEAVELIQNAGGIAVMAHPYQTKLQGDDLRNLVRQLADYGLEGIEAFYSQHSGEQTKEYLNLANEFGLVATAGSDFHGDPKPEIPMGMNVEAQFLRPFFEKLRIPTLEKTS